MRIIARTIAVLAFAAASMAFGAMPQMNVIVSDSSGKASYKGATDAKGTFATGALKPGNYVVQFTCKSPNVKGNTYALFISAGTKKVQADAVVGEKFAGGGVAMKIDVGAGLNITGQVTSGLQTKVDKGGKKMVWIPKKTGSNIPAHWAPADSAEAKETQVTNTMSTDDVMKRQSQGMNQTAAPGN
jgi:hypothetical protein